MRSWPRLVCEIIFVKARSELPARKCADREEIHTMLTFVRAGLAAALVLLLPALAAQPAAAQRQRQLAAARQIRAADSPGQRSGAFRAARSRRHGGLYRLSAHRQSGR